MELELDQQRRSTKETSQSRGAPRIPKALKSLVPGASLHPALFKLSAPEGARQSALGPRAAHSRRHRAIEPTLLPGLALFCSWPQELGQLRME